MGKFYNAMQKVSPSTAKEAVHPEPTKPALPELDEALLTPERRNGEKASDVFGQDHDVNFDTAVDSVPSLNTDDDLASPPGHEVSSEPAIRVNNSESESEPVSGQGRPFFSSMRRLRTDVFRRPIAAAYERIIQRLFAFRRTQQESVILVTSSIAGEGASTVARNIATALAQHRNERVLLIDANLRSPSQQLAFGLKTSDGLGDVLLGTASLTAAIQEDVVPGLSLLTGGRATESPVQLLTVASLNSVILGLMSLYDWVIIDGPPTTAYPDSASLATASSGVILVVEAESTRQEVVEEARRVLETSGVELVGAVLNRRRYHIPGFIYRRL